MDYHTLLKAYIAMVLSFFMIFISYFNDIINLLENNTTFALKFNEELSYDKIFYEGVLDAMANLAGNKIVCRTTNIYRAVSDAIADMKKEGKDITYIYLILDHDHLRAYYNGMFYEFTSLSYKFYANNTTILKCIIFDNGVDYLTGCSIIYYNGKILGEVPEDILETLIK